MRAVWRFHEAPVLKRRMLRSMIEKCSFTICASTRDFRTGHQPFHQDMGILQTYIVFHRRCKSSSLRARLAFTALSGDGQSSSSLEEMGHGVLTMNWSHVWGAAQQNENCAQRKLLDPPSPPFSERSLAALCQRFTQKQLPTDGCVSPSKQIKWTSGSLLD